MSYDLKPMKAPRAAGRALRALVAVAEAPGTGRLLAEKLLRDAGISALRNLPVTGPLPARLAVFDHGRACADPQAAGADLDSLYAGLQPLPAAGFQPETVADFADRYRRGETTPLAVAERALEISSHSDRRTIPMRTLIAQQRADVLEQAKASAERHAAGKPLSVLDGVPIAVKDELDQRGYPTTVGTRFLGTSAAAEDAEVVMRLRRAGALLVGKANMHEIGLGVTGLNPHHGSARNPYQPEHATGGSSSGSAAAVGMGLCPLAVGADGGGSIRVPAALCGQVGLKATHGRISERGAAEVCWTVAHIGPIAASVRDCALGYVLMAGPDKGDACSLLQPEPCFDDLAKQDLSGVRLGIYRPWFEDADGQVVKHCQAALDGLIEAGATLHEITIPELEVMRVAHLITIVSEMTSAHLMHYREHRQDYGLDVRLSLMLGRRLQAHDYVHAQRHRARIYRHFEAVLEKVDAIVTPATGCTAPRLAADALLTGESDLELTGTIIRFATAANLTGLPAISVPAGYDAAGLPIGIQLMGRAWEEHLLLRLAAVVEQRMERRAPQIHYRYFDPA